jgi:hypothetical protein
MITIVTTVGFPAADLRQNAPLQLIFRLQVEMALAPRRPLQVRIICGRGIKFP